MQDRRKINKCCMLYSICVFDAAIHPQIGNLADIAPQGAMIEGQAAITAEKPIQLRLELTPDITNKPLVEFPTQSKWYHPQV